MTPICLLGLALQVQPSADREAFRAAAMSMDVSRTLDLQWPGKVRFKLEPAPGEVVVRFDRALDEQAIKKFTLSAGADLADFRWNDESLVIRAVRGRQLSVVPTDHNSLLVRFSSSAAPSPMKVTADRDSDELDERIVLSQADVAAGYPGAARRELSAYAERVRPDARLQRALADAEFADGALTSAAERYRDLGATDYFARRAIAESTGSAVSEFVIRSAELFHQEEVGASVANLPISQAVTLGAGLRYVRSHFHSIGGSPAGFDDVRARSTIGEFAAAVRLSPWSRFTIQGSTLLDSSVHGWTLRFNQGSQERQIRLTAAARVPDFSTAEQVKYDGYLSRLAAAATLRLTPELVAQGEILRNSYGLARTGTLTRTVAPSGSVEYLVRRSLPSVTLSYRLDAEYVTGSRAVGAQAISIANRENHVVQVSSSFQIRRILASVYGGWVEDRVGHNNGPVAGIAMKVPIGGVWLVDATGGVSSISRPAVSGRQSFARVSLSRYLGSR